jgi:hypothetical protein
MTVRWPFSRQMKRPQSVGLRVELCRPPPTRAAPSPRAPPGRSTTWPLWDRVYVRVRLAQRLYARGQPDVNLPARWHLNSRHVPVQPIPREGSEHVQEIRLRRALLPPHIRRDQWRTQKKTSVGAKHMSGGFPLANSKDFRNFHTNMHRSYTNLEF